MRAVVVMAFVCVPAFSQPTAVFTYDVKTAEWPAGPEGLAQRLFEEWARRCKAVPGGALTVLECPPSLEIDDPESARIETRLALFRDLDETLHLAGCPDLEELERSRRRAGSRPTPGAGTGQAAARGCCQEQGAVRRDRAGPDLQRPDCRRPTPRRHARPAACLYALPQRAEAPRDQHALHPAADQR